MMLGQDTWYFARDHSWGVRRGGGGGNLPEAAVLQPHEIPDGVLYFMGIFQFGDRVVHFAQREDADGRVWHYEGELLYPLSTGKPSRRITQVDHDFRFREQLPRVICGGEVVIHAADAAKDTISISPLTDFWPGFAGYDEYRGYASGFWRGPSYTDAFVVDTTDPSEVAKVSMLSETFCEVRCGDAIGHGLVEMVFMGRNDHYGNWSSAGRLLLRFIRTTTSCARFSSWTGCGTPQYPCHRWRGSTAPGELWGRRTV
jgi:hypothetical protein